MVVVDGSKWQQMDVKQRAWRKLRLFDAWNKNFGGYFRHCLG